MISFSFLTSANLEEEIYFFIKKRKLGPVFSYLSRAQAHFLFLMLRKNNSVLGFQLQY